MSYVQLTLYERFAIYQLTSLGLECAISLVT